MCWLAAKHIPDAYVMDSPLGMVILYIWIKVHITASLRMVKQMVKVEFTRLMVMYMWGK